MEVMVFILGLVFIGCVYDIMMKWLDRKVKHLEALVDVKKEENKALRELVDLMKQAQKLKDKDV